MNCKGKRILLVDDEAVLMIAEAAMLEKNGYVVSMALSGEKALDIIMSGERFDMVLMDIDLGTGMDGTEAASCILEICNVPLIFMSNHTDPEIVRKTDGISSCGYFVKSSGEAVLLASIKMAFRLVNKGPKHVVECDAVNGLIVSSSGELVFADEEVAMPQAGVLSGDSMYRKLFRTSNDGICVHEIVYKDGRASDYRILEVNPMYEQILGFKNCDVAGKLATEIYNVVPPPYLEIYASVAETEVPVVFETYFEPMDRYFHISVFSPDKGFFATVFQDITGRTRSEKFLSESEERYRALAEVSPNAIIVHVDGIIVYINATGLGLFGAGSDRDMLGTDFLTLVQPCSSEFTGELINPLNEKGAQSQTCEVLMLKMNGEKFYAEVISYPFIYQGRRAVQVVVRDISERKKYEEVLNEQRSLLEAVISAIPAPVFFKDRNGMYTGCNTAFAEFLGIPRDDVIGKTVFDVAPGEMARIYHESDLQLFTHGGKQVFESDVKYADGAMHHVIFHKAVMSMADGVPGGIAGIMLDITEMKKNEEELRRIKEDLEKAQEASHIGSWQWHINEDRLEWSDEMYKIFGVDKDTFTGRLSDVLVSCIHPDDLDKVIETNTSVIKACKPIPLEYRVKRKDGSERTVWAEASDLVISDSGKPVLLKGYLQDITENKKNKDSLERMISEKESLLYEFQHRVKNNLAMISGLITLESIRAENEHALELLKSLKNRVDALEKLYSSLYQSGEMKEIRLDQYICEIAGSVMRTYVRGVQNIKLETELSPCTIAVRNAASIGLIINELLINALKYAFPDNREGVIIVGLGVCDECYEFFVADNGIGPGDDHVINDMAGSGMMIINMLTEHMGGTFSFEREDMTRFRVVLPREG